jgi:hypothetical protein
MNWKLLVGAAILVVTGSIFYFKSKEFSSVPTSTDIPSVASNSATQQTATFDLVIKNKKLISGPETIQVRENDQVTLNITSDEDEELHIHGYDKSVNLEKDKPTTLTFLANLTGRFPYELEKSATDIGTLEVRPR